MILGGPAGQDIKQAGLLLFINAPDQSGMHS